MVDNSPGPGGIYPRLLRGTRGKSAKTPTKIFVSSLVTGKVPEGRKGATTVLLLYLREIEIIQEIIIGQ